jgi:hypothetical protein
MSLSNRLKRSIENITGVQIENYGAAIALISTRKRWAATFSYRVAPASASKATHAPASVAVRR